MRQITCKDAQLARMKQALALRAQGLSYKAIGEKLPGLTTGNTTSAAYAQQLLHRALSFARMALCSYSFGEAGPSPTTCYRALHVLETYGDRCVPVVDALPPEQVLTQRQMEMSMDDLGLGNRAQNCMRNANIETVGELVLWTAKDLLKVKNLGKVVLEEIRYNLADEHLALKGECVARLSSSQR